MIEEIKQIVLTKNKVKFNSIIKIENNLSSEHIKYIMNSTLFLNSNSSLKERIYCLINNITSVQKCEYCNEPVKFKNEYRSHCSSKCAQLNPNVRLKNENTNLRRHGVKSVLSNTAYKEICTLKKYGVKNVANLEYIKIKRKKTKLEKYGDENYVNVEKNKNTCLERYGVSSVSKLEINREKARETFKKNYSKIHEKFIEKNGVDNPSQLLSVQEKKKYNGLQKYGVLFQQKHLSKNSIELLNDIQYLKDHTTAHILKETGISQSHLSKILIKNNLSDGIKSTLERDIINFLKNNNIKFIKNSRSIIKPLELDIYIPEFKLAIEINGCYYHSEERVGRKYHINKTNLCEEKGIQLLHIYDHYLYNSISSDIIYSILSNKLKLNKNKIYARKCIVKEINSKQCNEFLLANHLQGPNKATLRLGLFYEQKLISVMTFGNSRFTKNKIELIRFCNKKYTSVVGGANKLFKYFLQNHWDKITEIISYADRSYSNGQLYETMGFNKIKITSPGYFYVKGIEFKNRQYFMKHKLKDKFENYNDNLTEYQNCRNNGWLRIWDSGQLIFTKI